MTTFGVMSIGFGAFYFILSLCMVFMGTNDGAAVSAMGAGGAYPSFVWVACTAIHAQLIASGVGLLKVATWGRTLGLAYGGASLIINGSWLFMSGFSPLPAMALIFTTILVAMCISQPWKDAMGPASHGGSSSSDAVSSAAHDTREAA